MLNEQQRKLMASICLLSNEDVYQCIKCLSATKYVALLNIGRALRLMNESIPNNSAYGYVVGYTGKTGFFCMEEHPLTPVFNIYAYGDTASRAISNMVLWLELKGL